MPVAVTPPLTPIEEGREGGLPSPRQPLAWKCCKCDLLNYFFDDNHAWFHRIPEYCAKLACLHQRCAACFDPGHAYWPIHYADGRPIAHLFEELQRSLGGDENASDGAGESDCESAACTSIITTSSGESSSDAEHHWRSIPETAQEPSSGSLGAPAHLPYHYCPLRETHLCPERFESADDASRHSRVHVGDEAVPCPLASCHMTFPGKEVMRLHYIAMHS